MALAFVRRRKQKNKHNTTTDSPLHLQSSVLSATHSPTTNTFDVGVGIYACRLQENDAV